MRVASFEQRNVTVSVKMVSKFDKSGKKYLEPVPRIAFLVSGKYNRIPSDPDFLRDLGSFLMTLGDALDGLDLPDERLCSNDIRNMVERCQETMA